MTKLIESQNFLLCCRYVLVNFKTLAVQVRQDGVATS